MREKGLKWRGTAARVHRATRRPVGLFLLLICGLGLDAGLGAEASTYDSDRSTGRHLTLDEIVVSGDSVVEPQSTELGSRKIEKGRNITLPDVLKHEPDIDLRRRALVGDSGDSLAIRGFSGGRIMLNINGRPVNAAGVWGASIIDWSTIPLDNIEKVELIKGGSSAKYGNNALGGVVNVVTKKPTATPTLTFFGTYGASDDIDSMQNYRLTHSYKVGPVGYALAGSYQKSEPYLWNNDFKARNLASTVYVDMPFKGQLTLGCQYANSERGYIMANRRSNDPYSPDFNTKLNADYPLAFGDTFSPYSGFAYLPGAGASSDKTKTYLDLGYSQPLGPALLEMKLYRNYEESHEKNYARSDINPAYRDGQLVLDRKVESDCSSGGSLELSAVMGDHELLSGLERKILAYGDVTTKYVDLNYNVTNYMPWVKTTSNVAKPNTEGQCWAYYLQDNWQLNERWLLTAGLRYDSYKNKPVYGDPSPLMRDEGWSPKLTASYQLSGQDTLTASVYQALRTPGVGEAYWWAYGATHGVPELKPEKNNAGELLYMHTFSDADFARVSAYYYDIEDYVMMRFDPNWRGVYNIDSVEIYGLAFDGKLALADWLSANAAVSYQKSEKKGDIHDTYRLTDELDYLPQWKASLGADVMLPRKSVFSVSLRYVDERETLYNYQDAAKKSHCTLIELDSYLTADISLKVPLGKHAEFSCYAENLFSEDYEERFGYPMPGVVVGAALKLSL